MPQPLDIIDVRLIPRSLLFVLEMPADSTVCQCSWKPAVVSLQNSQKPGAGGSSIERNCFKSDKIAEISYASKFATPTDLTSWEHRKCL